MILISYVLIIGLLAAFFSDISEGMKKEMIFLRSSNCDNYHNLA